MRARFVLPVVIASFVMGYFAHVLFRAHRLDQQRRKQESFFRVEFPVGDDFGRATEKYAGLGLKNTPGTNLYCTYRGEISEGSLFLVVEIDEQKRIKRVDVQRVDLSKESCFR